MAGSPEFRKHRFIPFAPAFLMVASLFVSCEAESILVVSDPYIDTVQGGAWGPTHPSFTIMARLSGYRVLVATAENADDFRAIVESAGDTAGIVLVSPLNAAGADRLPPGERRIVVAGGTADDDNPVVRVAMDRTKAMAEAGLLAARIAEAEGGPAVALFSLGNRARFAEIEALSEAFDSGTDQKLFVHTVDGLSGELAMDFLDEASNSSVLLLFSGPANITVMEETANEGIPVITEGRGGSHAWDERIAGSVEDDRKALNRALMETIRDEERRTVPGYDAKFMTGRLSGTW